MNAWNDSNVMPHVQAAAREIGARFGVLDIGGYRSGPDAQDHGKGLAIDVMTNSGTAIAQFAQQNAERLGITYIIWNRAIWDSRNTRGWEPYKGPSPHTDHVHISFKPEGGDPTATFTAATQNEGCARILGKLIGGS